ncbi:MMPL family transporter [Microterricola viridarii]|uniref:Putative drug exporter of the RND superfamily n=1 Tax=Microterricola viridarii TaxID=412690 RepID=A0A1H1R5N9_9MICO|nr:MMPL family transporter [Microterricola viridarii]SDS31053.1 putative drug exporter of the RND superfamily [Microterricola viridarii]
MNKTALDPATAPPRPSTRVPRWLRATIPAVLILVWFALFGIGGASFGKIGDVATNDAVQFLPASSEATQVQQIQSEFRGTDAIPAIVIFQRDGGLTDADRAAIADAASAFQGTPGVLADGVSPAIPSEDGEAAEVFVQIDATGEVKDTVVELRAELAELDTPGLTSILAGPAGFTADLSGAFAGIDGLLLAVALSAVFLILVIVYRSPLLPLIMLGSSMAALCAAVFVVVQLAAADILLINGQTQGILFILVIGAATDYSLLYIARYREALHVHESKWAATWAALRGSWEPILAAGGTVIAALLLLLFSDLNSNKILGPVAAIGIVFALLASLTLLPALMLWAGRTAFWPRRPKLGEVGPSEKSLTEKGAWPAVARFIRRRPRTIWITSTLLLGVMALGMLGLKADGVPSSEFVLGESQSRDGQALISEHFPGGSGTPAVIVAPEGALQDAADVALTTDGVASVTVLSADSPSGSLPVTSDGIQAIGAPGAAPTAPTVIDGRVLLQATLDYPGDSLEAEALVTELRAELAGVGTAEDPVLVGGTTAVALDTNTAAIHDRNLIIPLVLIVIMLILMLLLRAIVAPLLLIASVVLSFASALGVSAIVFNNVFDFAGADPVVPLFGFVFLVALGVDYNIFLMTRVREEALVHGSREGVLRGLVVTGGVITSAGLVLAATFAALGVLPILFLAQLAFIVAFGVLLDTFLVRSLLIPALSYDIGRAIWWPSKLSRMPEEPRSVDAR